MAQGPFSKEAFWSSLEALGENEVRIRLRTNRFGSVHNKRQLVEEWLLRKEISRNDASNLEQKKIARSAKNAAWTAAIAAIIAAIFAAISLIIRLN